MKIKPKHHNKDLPTLDHGKKLFSTILDMLVEGIYYTESSLDNYLHQFMVGRLFFNNNTLSFWLVPEIDSIKEAIWLSKKKKAQNANMVREIPFIIAIL